MFTYLLQCIKFNIEQIIYDQQNQKTHLMKLTLNSDQFVQKTITKEMNNDENDELQIIDVKDEIEKEKKKEKKKDKTVYEI